MPVTYFLPRDELDRLFGALVADGRRIVGPTIADGAVVYDELNSSAELPYAWTADTAPGSYRLRTTGDRRAFDYGGALTSWKRFTHPSQIPLTRAHRDADRIAAGGIQERAMRAGPGGDPDHAARRDAALIVAVECAMATSTCFCTSMASGPEVDHGADLVLSELDDGFVVRVGSNAGIPVVASLGLRAAAPDEVERATAQVAAVREAIGDPVAADGLAARLRTALDHPRWSEVAERCLACANCTLVCPTCFCTSVGVASDLDGADASTERSWDSCFSLGFGRVAGDANFRPKVRDRYRQWLTHKFSTWWDQFGSSGCVGCGRGIAWGPGG